MGTWELKLLLKFNFSWPTTVLNVNINRQQKRCKYLDKPFVSLFVGMAEVTAQVGGLGPGGRHLSFDRRVDHEFCDGGHDCVSGGGGSRPGLYRGVKVSPTSSDDCVAAAAGAARCAATQPPQHNTHRIALGSEFRFPENYSRV